MSESGDSEKTNSKPVTEKSTSPTLLSTYCGACHKIDTVVPLSVSTHHVSKREAFVGDSVSTTVNTWAYSTNVVSFVTLPSTSSSN